jgi:hypothetical protein
MADDPQAVSVYPVAVVGGGWRMSGPGSEAFGGSVWDSLDDAEAACRDINARRLTSRGLIALGRSRGAKAAVRDPGGR